MIETYIIDSKKDGPIITIIGGIHGNEPTGVEVIKYLSNNLKINIGKIYLIIANKLAIQEKKRYIDTDLNRLFGSIDTFGNESNIAKKIKPYLQNSDYLLDLHNTVLNKSPRFLITNSENISSLFDVEYVALGVSNKHSGSTDYYMNKLGKVAICIECGRIYSKENHKAKAIKNVMNFLRYVGMINGTIFHYNPKVIMFDGIYMTKENIKLERQFEDFEYIQQGTLIGQDGNTKILSPYDGYILFAMNQSSPNGEGFLYGKIK